MIAADYGAHQNCALSAPSSSQQPGLHICLAKKDLTSTTPLYQGSVSSALSTAQGLIWWLQLHLQQLP